VLIASSGRPHTKLLALQERLKKEYMSANKEREAGVDESEEEEPKQATGGEKSMKKLVNRHERNEGYDSDEEGNPYVSEVRSHSQVCPARADNLCRRKSLRKRRKSLPTNLPSGNNLRLRPRAPLPSLPTLPNKLQPPLHALLHPARTPARTLARAPPRPPPLCLFRPVTLSSPSALRGPRCPSPSLWVPAARAARLRRKRVPRLRPARPLALPLARHPVSRQTSAKLRTTATRCPHPCRLAMRRARQRSASPRRAPSMRRATRSRSQTRW
jgi:hypothetical protein